MRRAETIFVFMHTLTGLGLLFLTGLYYDAGECFARLIEVQEQDLALTAAGRDPLGVGQRSRNERDAVLPLVESWGAPAMAYTLEEASYYRSTSRTPVGEIQGAVRRDQLVVDGYRHEDFLRLESLGAMRDGYDRTMEEVLGLVASGLASEAEARIREAVAATDPANLLVLHDYWSFLMRLQSDQDRVGEARDSAGKVRDILDQIIQIRQVAYQEIPDPELETRIRAHREEGRHLIQLVRALDREVPDTTRVAADDYHRALTDLRRALREGEISGDEYAQAIQELQRL